jgi:hypothetical protein
MPSYKIVYSDAMGLSEYVMIQNLEAKVKALLAEGWSCIGGVAMSFSESGYILQIYQTMIK